ncbi:hypothetical protein, partial [Pseudomonas sp. HMSC08G10]|uniref:hypothetical protein n=1 Tax=Pseudomonas sp. HMSC08G10 TaxID=1581141 RepID=UPI001C45531D
LAKTKVTRRKRQWRHHRHQIYTRFNKPPSKSPTQTPRSKVGRLLAKAAPNAHSGVKVFA